jgi:hypothetical protein
MSRPPGVRCIRPLGMANHSDGRVTSGYPRTVRHQRYPAGSAFGRTNVPRWGTVTTRP